MTERVLTTSERGASEPVLEMPREEVGVMTGPVPENIGKGAMAEPVLDP